MGFRITDRNRHVIENKTTRGLRLEIGLADTNKDQLVSKEEFNQAKPHLEKFAKSSEANKTLLKKMGEYFKEKPDGYVRYDAALNEIDFTDDEFHPLSFRDPISTQDIRSAGFENGRCYLIDERNVKTTYLENRGLKIESIRGNSDMGDFFCERTFFASNRWALQPGSSVSRLQDFHDQPLVGFFHITEDDFTRNQRTDYDPSVRHKFTIQSVGQGIRGYVDIIRKQEPDKKEIHIALTGFGSFLEIINNPTGEFVTNEKLIKEAIEYGMQDKAESIQVKRESDGLNITLTINGVKLVIHTKKLPVSNKAFGENGLQDFLSKSKPDAIINLGVGWNYDMGDRYQGLGEKSLVRIEYKADNKTGWVDPKDGRVKLGEPYKKTLEYNNGTLQYAMRKAYLHFNENPSPTYCPM